MIPLNSICNLLKIEGQEALGFLNNLIISDLEAWPKSQFYYSAICNPKGRIICSLWINKINDDEIIIAYPKNMETIESFLKMRTFRMKLSISSLDSQLYMNDSGEIIASSDENEEQGNIENEYQLLMNKLELPWVDNSNTEKFIPQHVNLDLREFVMDFKKGCYPGQEIIARIKYLGKIKKRMKLFASKNHEDVEDLGKLERVSKTIFNPKKDQYETQIIQSTKI